MNIRKEHDYSALHAGIDQAICAGLSQMELYYELGRLICARPEKGAAVAAAAYLAEKYPDQAGFSARNMRRMRDFYRMYENAPELLTRALRLSWTQNMVILEADLTLKERAWYLQATKQFGWSKLALQKKIAEAAHLTEVLDLTSKMCYTEENEAATMSFAQNDTGRQLLFQLVHRRARGKSLEFALSIRREHPGREPPTRHHDPPLLRNCLIIHVGA